MIDFVLNYRKRTIGQRYVTEELIDKKQIEKRVKKRKNENLKTRFTGNTNEERVIEFRVVLTLYFSDLNVFTWHYF